jgi:hypothetical protein
MTARESTIRGILDALILERRRLRTSADAAAPLEANRLAIVYWQGALARCQPVRDRGYTGQRSRM